MSDRDLHRKLGSTAYKAYRLWGPGNYTGKSVIVLGSDGTGERERFQHVEVAGRVDDAFARGDERFDLYFCQDLNGGLREVWPSIKKW